MLDLLSLLRRSPLLVFMLSLMPLHTPIKTLLVLLILSFYAPSCSYKDPLPIGRFGSQEEAVRTVKQYAVLRGFAVNIVCRYRAVCSRASQLLKSEEDLVIKERYQF